MKAICEICGAEFDLDSEGWMETDTGDVCPKCVAAAEAPEEPGDPALE